MIHIYSGILLSNENNEIMSFAATRVQLEMIILGNISQKEKDKYHLISLRCVIQNMTKIFIYIKLYNLFIYIKNLFIYFSFIYKTERLMTW